MDQSALNVVVVTVELSIGFFNEKRPDFTLIVRLACYETGKSVSSSSLVCTESIIDSNHCWSLATVKHQ